MKTSFTIIGAAAAFFALVSSTPASSAEAFRLQSVDLVAGKPIPQTFAFNGFGCTGQNTSPALSWSNPPAGTKSFAVFVHDQDAVTGGGRLLALGRGQSAARGDRLGAWCGYDRRSCTARACKADRNRLWNAGVGRPLSTGRSQAASLHLHGVRVEGGQARPAAKRDCVAQRLHGQRERHRQGELHKQLRSLEMNMNRSRLGWSATLVVAVSAGGFLSACAGGGGLARAAPFGKAEVVHAWTRMDWAWRSDAEQA